MSDNLFYRIKIENSPKSFFKSRSKIMESSFHFSSRNFPWREIFLPAKKTHTIFLTPKRRGRNRENVLIPFENILFQQTHNSHSRFVNLGYLHFATRSFDVWNFFSNSGSLLLPHSSAVCCCSKVFFAKRRTLLNKCTAECN